MALIQVILTLKMRYKQIAARGSNFFTLLTLVLGRGETGSLPVSFLDDRTNNLSQTSTGSTQTMIYDSSQSLGNVIYRRPIERFGASPRLGTRLCWHEDIEACHSLCQSVVLTVKTGGHPYVSLLGLLRPRTLPEKFEARIIAGHGQLCDTP